MFKLFVKKILLFISSINIFLQFLATSIIKLSLIAIAQIFPYNKINVLKMKINLNYGKRDLNKLI